MGGGKEWCGDKKSAAKLNVDGDYNFGNEIYCNLTGKESVHLADYPVCDESVINEEIERRMDIVIEFISMGRTAREDAKIKVRQPLNSVILDGKYESIIGDIDSLIKEELNVKNINYNILQVKR